LGVDEINIEHSYILRNDIENITFIVTKFI
jgi:hypothetical protein